MNKIWASIVKRKKIIQFLLCIVIIGLVVGIVFYYKQGDINKENIGSNMNFFITNLEIKRINGIFFHLIAVTMLFVLSFLIIGFPAAIIYLFYESLSIGFSLAVFNASFKFSGLLFGLIFNVICKSVFLILLLIFNVKIFDVSRNIIGSIFFKRDKTIKRLLLVNIKFLILIVGFVLLNDLILYLFGTSIIKFFIFLLV